MNHQTRQVPRSTPEVEIYQNNLQRRQAISQARSESSLMPSGKTMIIAAVSALVVAILGYITYKLMKRGK